MESAFSENELQKCRELIQEYLMANGTIEEFRKLNNNERANQFHSAKYSLHIPYSNFFVVPCFNKQQFKEEWELPDEALGGVFGRAISFAERSSWNLQFEEGQVYDFIICEVAVGKVMPVYKPDRTLSQEALSKQGFDSVLVPKGIISKSTEYLIYNPNQILSRYFVSFRPTLYFYKHGIGEAPLLVEVQKDGNEWKNVAKLFAPEEKVPWAHIINIFRIHNTSLELRYLR